MISLSTARMLVWFAKVYILALFFSPFIQSALALSELFEVYNSPQAVGMGNAFTADAHGYASLFYNPAGLAKQTKRDVEVTLLDIEAIGGTTAIGQSFSAQSFGAYRLPGELHKNAGSYNYLHFSAVPAIVFRGIAFGLLGSYRYAGVSDGTNLDVDTVTDVGPVLGVARNFAGNLLRLGVNVKAMARNQMKGIYAHSVLATHNDSTFPTLYKEGIGASADLGGQLVFPNKFLPTLAFCWKDIGGMNFQSGKFLNNQASGTPDAIPQSVNAGFSIHPYLSGRLKTTFAIEMRHIELGGLPLRKRIHIGMQFEDERALYFWLGANQLYPTGGVGYRVKGGNLELGTYAQDIGVGDETKADRRIFFRYTIGF